MQHVNSASEPFFEDVVNHMAAICATPIAMVALASSGRFWINRAGQECGEETDAFTPDLFDHLGQASAVVNDFSFPDGVWPAKGAPRSYIVTPLELHGDSKGVLLIADQEPRNWGDFEKNYMTRSARLVAGHFEARAALVERDRALREVSAYKSALDKFAIVSVADARGAIIHANDKFCAISKCSREELLGADHRIVNSGHHPKSFFVDMWRTIGSGNLWRGEICNIAKDGSTYWVDSTIVPLIDECDAQAKTYMSIRVDCTERHVAQEKLAAALDALEQERNSLESRVAERTLALEGAVCKAQEASEAKSMFLATVSHELRTPLHQIISYAEMVNEEIEDGLSDTSQVTDDVGAILTSSRHLLSLINDILDFSKNEAGKITLRPERFALGPLLDECLASVHHSAERNSNTIVIEIKTGAEELHTDRIRLKQCLLNLMSNASKFTSNGTILVTANKTYAACGAWLRISVADTGIGISSEAQQRLFEPFFQVDSSLTRSLEGTGLGLALTQKLAHLLGGSLSAESTPGVGSTFTIDLPLNEALAGAD